MFIRLLSIFFILTQSFMFGQLAVTNNAPNNTEAYLVNDILCDDGLTTSNFSSTGFASGIGYFDGFASNIGFEEGVVLSTGGICLPVPDCNVGAWQGGSGVSGDADLELALNAINLSWDVNNVTILEFDFVANSESVEFNYVFASAEYTSWTCSSFNDIFGFFLSGPGIAGPYSNNAINLAYIPEPEGAVDYEDWLAINTGLYTNTPVAVNTINAGDLINNSTCDNIDPNYESYNVFWVDNDYSGAGWQGVNEPQDPEFTVASTQTWVSPGITGFTTPLKAVYNGLECGETYHIKLAVADASDGSYNSAVFLEAGSFVSPSVLVNPISNIDGPDLFDDPLAIYEGCAAAQLEFTASQNTDYDIQLEVIFEGDAENSIDYNITYNGGNELDECLNDAGELSQCVTIPAGQNIMYLDIEANYDDIVENFENLNITVNSIDGLCQQADLAVSEIFFNLYDQIDILVDPGVPPVIECIGDEVLLEPFSISGGYIGVSGEYTFEWYDADGTLVSSEPSILVNSESASEYQLIVYDDCQDQQTTTNFSVDVITYPTVDTTFPEYYACDDDMVVITPNISGGSGNYSYVWPDDPTPCDCESFNYLFELENGISQTVDFQIIDNCTEESYSFSIPVELDVTIPPSAQINVTGTQFCPGDEIILDIQVSGASTYAYEWLNLDVDEYYVNNLATISPVDDTTYDVIVRDECNNTESVFSILIETPAYEPPTFLVPDVAGCLGQELEVVVENLFSNGVTDPSDINQYNFLWSTGETTPSINVVVEDVTTSYSVEISDLCGNTSSAVIANVVPSVPPPPQFSFEETPEGHQFVQLSSGFFTNFQWDFGDGNTSSDFEPLHLFSQEGDYYVTLTASDDLDCQNSSTQIVNIYASLLFYSPNVFSPNGDGINDYFNVSVVGHDDFELFVFDRWGKQLFNTKDPNEGWDGTYQNGEEVPQDVYMYKVLMSNSGVGEKIEKGRVSIIK